MNIKCICIFRHKWIYFPSEGDISHSGIKGDEWYEGRGKRTKTRICLKCHRKQEWIDAVTPDFPSGWNRGYNPLSSDEKRHLKLIELDI